MVKYLNFKIKIYGMINSNPFYCLDTTLTYLNSRAGVEVVGIRNDNNTQEIFAYTKKKTWSPGKLNTVMGSIENSLKKMMLPLNGEMNADYLPTANIYTVPLRSMDIDGGCVSINLYPTKAVAKKAYLKQLDIQELDSGDLKKHAPFFYLKERVKHAIMQTGNKPAIKNSPVV